MRSCPACHIPLDPVTVRRQNLDRCPQCRGLFLDKGELAALVDMARIAREIVLDEPDIDTIPTTERDREMPCPADGTLMEPVDAAGIIVDYCPTCGGVWLDFGEIAALKLAENNIRENLRLYIRLGN